MDDRARSRIKNAVATLVILAGIVALICFAMYQAAQPITME